MFEDISKKVAADLGISLDEAERVVSTFIKALADEIVKMYGKDQVEGTGEDTDVVVYDGDNKQNVKMMSETRIKMKPAKVERKKVIYAPPGWKASENRKLPLDDAHEVYRWDILVTVHDKHVLDDVLDLMKEYTGLSEIVDFIVIPPDEAPLVRIGVQEYVDKNGKSRRILFVMYNR